MLKKMKSRTRKKIKEQKNKSKYSEIRNHQVLIVKHKRYARFYFHFTVYGSSSDSVFSIAFKRQNLKNRQSII